MGNNLRTKLKLALFLVTTGMVASPSFADQTIKVSLWDKGSQVGMIKTMAYSGKMDHAMATTMGVKLSIDRVKAGKITFDVKNDAKETIHEMLVFPLADNIGPKINDNEGRIDEDIAHSLGEVSETDPGKTGKLTLNLKPGKYLITCNLPGHYMNGMWSLLTVE